VKNKFQYREFDNLASRISKMQEQERKNKINIFVLGKDKQPQLQERTTQHRQTGTGKLPKI